jgi:beta-lactamase regulating signal transducer with metallopeptidase domain
MNELLNDWLTAINGIGETLWQYSSQVFVQSSILIILLLIIDFLLRKRVRATLRYWMWMLVFLKLILPPTLSLPTGVGYWLGGCLSPTPVVHEEQSAAPMPEPTTVAATEIPMLPVDGPPVPFPETIIEPVQPTAPVATHVTPPTWKGIALLVWLGGISAFSILLLRRIRFVRRLIAQSTPAEGDLLKILNQCRADLGITRDIQLKISSGTPSPAACGLLKPAILMPQTLPDKLSPERLRAIFIHELAHIKRGDLWINSAQTLLQVIYFYNPLLWLANAVVRRVREQAVDETVLVALGAEAKSYSNALIDIAEMAFFKPSLSLRLVGVVELRKALQGRIKHMLNRPIPKNAKIGVLGLLVVILMAAVLLPMAKSDEISESRKIRSLVEILQQDNNLKRGSAAVDLAEIIENEAITHVSANKALRAITSRIKKHPKTMGRQRRFDSYPNIFWEEIGLAFELILSRKIEQDNATDFLQALELVGCNYGKEGENVFRLFGQLSIPRKDIVVNYTLKALPDEGESIPNALLDVYPISVGGAHTWGREREIDFEPDKSVQMELSVTWYQIFESALRSLPPSWRENDQVLKDVVQSASAKKLCGYTKKLSLAQESDRNGIFGQDSANRQSNHEEGQFKIRLPNGVTVELVGICKDPNKRGQRWWLPNGMAMKEPKYELRGKESSRFPAFGYLLRFTPHSDLAYRSHVNLDYLAMSSGPVTREGQAVVMWGQNDQPREPLPTQADIVVDVAAGDWKVNEPARHSIYDEFTYTSDKKVIIVSGLRPNPQKRTIKKTLIEATTTSFFVNIKLECITKDGKSHDSWHEGTLTQEGQLIQHTFGFTVPIDRIEKINVMYRPYHRVEFKNVSIKRGRKTDVQIEVYTDQQSSEERPGLSDNGTKVLKALEAERDALRTRMDDYRRRIYQLEQEYGSMKVLEGRQKMILQRVVGLLDKLTEQEAKRMELEGQSRRAELNSKINEAMLRLEQELATLKQKYTPTHPKVVEKAELLDAVKTRSKRLTLDTGNLTDLRAELERVRKLEKRLEATIEKEDIDTVRVGRIMLEISDLEDRLSLAKERLGAIHNRIRNLKARQSSADNR